MDFKIVIGYENWIYKDIEKVFTCPIKAAKFYAEIKVIGTTREIESLYIKKVAMDYKAKRKKKRILTVRRPRTEASPTL